MICPTCSSPNPDESSICRTCGSPIGGPADGPDPHALPPGTLLAAGNYRIERLLGQGGFGLTYEAQDQSLGRAVAIKELFPAGSVRAGRAVRPAGGLSRDELAAARARFLVEARVLARFHHPGIVQVFTSFEENETAYMVMELLRGETLAARLERCGPLPEAKALSIIVGVGEALGAVHDAGLFHRDLKPENLMLTPEGRAVLIDFGTAREFAAGSTRRMTAMLTPGYAPLEQYSQQARFGTFTDVYALAGTLYHALTGQLPVAALDRVQGVELPPPHTLRPEIRRSVSDAIMWALEVSIQKRPASVREFLTALRSSRQAPLPTAGRPGGTREAMGGGAAVTHRVEDVIRLLESEPETAEKELYSGRLEGWLAQSLRGTALSARMREVVARHPRERWKGVELVLRELYRAIGEDPYPLLQAEPTTLDLGEVVQGGRAVAHLRLRNQGRGHAWGSVTVQPALPGLAVPASLPSATARLEVALDTVETPPGEYSGQVIISAEGVPNPVTVPVRFRVLPLSVAVEPKSLDFGTLRAGEKTSAGLRVSTQPVGGRLAGTAALSRFAEGMSVTPTLAGPSPELQVTVDTRNLQAGSTYRTEVRLATNAGTFTVPVRVRVGIPWANVASPAVTGALTWGAGLTLVRLTLALSVGSQAWIDVGGQPLQRLPGTWVLVWGVWLAIALSTRRLRRTLGAPLASWSGVKWLLASAFLACGGLLLLLGGLGMGLAVALDRMGRTLLPTASPLAGWALLGALLGLLYGAAPGLVRAGRPQTGAALHWIAVAMTLCLGAWGWLGGR